VPANPFRLVAVITELCVAPADIVRDVGLAVRSKSGVVVTSVETDGRLCGACDDVAAVDGVATSIKEINANNRTVLPTVRRSFIRLRYGRLTE